MTDTSMAAQQSKQKEQGGFVSNMWETTKNKVAGAVEMVKEKIAEAQKDPDDEERLPANTSTSSKMDADTQSMPHSFNNKPLGKIK